MSLFSKNNSSEFKELDAFSVFIDSLLIKDSYISHKEYSHQFEDVQATFKKLSLMDDEKVLNAWCKQNKTEYRKLKYLLDKCKNAQTSIEDHNEVYVKKHLEIDKEYLDHVLEKDDSKIKLDEEQRRVVLCDEDYTLVIAGAGAGKTTTIEAKVKYLVDKKGVNPDSILIVSFTRKATQELRERFERLELPVNIATFHSIGNTIIKENENETHRIVDQGFMYDAIKEYLIDRKSVV